MPARKRTLDLAWRAWMEHKIAVVTVRQNAVIYTCSCGEKFIGAGTDSSGAAKVPDSLTEHLKSKKGE